MTGLDKYTKGKAWLEKMGWKEGQGLGKNNDGIKKYIGVVKKADTAGVGVDKFQWDDMWWDNMFNKAAKNITPGSEVKAAEPQQAVPLYHGTFTKTTSADSSDEEKGDVEGDELLQKCEGRLLRKYVPEGKLKRIQHQETKFINGEDLIPPAASPKKAEKTSPKLDKTEKSKKSKKSEKSDVSEDSDASEALSSVDEEEKEKEDKKKNKKEKNQTEEPKKRKRDTEASSSESDSEEEIEKKEKAKKKERREKKDKKAKNKRHAKDKATDKDEKKRKHKDSKEKKKHKRIKS